MKNKRDALKELQALPGIGPKTARELWELGVRDAKSMGKANPEKLFEKLCRKKGGVDRCVLYLFRTAHYHASSRKPEKKKLKWWNWKDSEVR